MEAVDYVTLLVALKGNHYRPDLNANPQAAAKEHCINKSHKI